MQSLKIVAIAGSLRLESFNRKLVRANQKLAPEGLEIEHVLLDDVEVYNMDVEKSNFPEAVTNLKRKVVAADGVLFVTPEHNFSFSGVLKNAIDWASRPYGEGCWDNKPVAIQSASTGYMGGIRAQLHLRQVLGFFSMNQLYFPEVTVSAADKKFDENGDLVDERSIESVKRQLAAFREFILRHNALG